MNVEIRKALPEDFELVTKVGYDTFYETWKDVNTPEDMNAYLKNYHDIVRSTLFISNANR